MVTPSDDQNQQLDEIAINLDEEMTIANVNNYVRTSHMSTKAGASNVTDPRTHKTAMDYTIAWICALPTEMAAAKGMLDEVQESLQTHPGDGNSYILGRIGLHNIVITCLPHYGTTPAAVMVSQMTHTFRHIRLLLLVGIGGGAPSGTADIRLGDVVVSCPTKRCGGVLQHDFGKITGEEFEMTGMLNKPPRTALISIARLRMEHLMGRSNVHQFIAEMLAKNPDMRMTGFLETNYEHVHSAPACQDCDDSRAVNRSQRETNAPTIHYGLIASGNQVVKHGVMRDRLAKKHGILCFEMEAAALMDNFPCLVIRGISDYADSHKNEEWQGYAAAAAAGYAKDLLLVTLVLCPELCPGQLDECSK
ncbi:nucleoside phosphorylase [Aspergillus steynii IBT 23096]|uniref:Nucleoside phosphorylase n=1 Tax=Aspergillus steynii IBT 23096 TaxID=1392250 RepID=A0A2I2G660_9EURO|nr:nucleoside phosphorylase [Aspergillus steynii IBT 23096]PLB48358.1 nucleoside phosphorylase [Aspergillus steynii IBT 23096]